MKRILLVEDNELNRDDTKPVELDRLLQKIESLLANKDPTG